MIASQVKRLEAEERSRAVFAYHTAQLTGIAVRNPRHFPEKPENYFLFLQDKPKWQIVKERMARIAAAHNGKGAGI